jgi:hypothetical protein
MIDGFKSNSDPDNAVVYAGLIKLLNNNRNTEFPTFNERFDYLISTIDPVILEIIDVSTKDFKWIKNIRDRVAHGGSPKTKDNYDISHEIKIKNKLIILTFYLIYKDLGLTDKDFINCLEMRFNKFIRSADLNIPVIDRALGKVAFININSKTLKAIKEYSTNQIVLRHENDEFHFMKELSENVRKDWLRLNKKASIEEYLASIVDKAIRSVSYTSHLYLEDESEQLDIWSVCILNSPINIDPFMLRTITTDTQN